MRFETAVTAPMGAKNDIRPRTEYEALMKQTAADPKRLKLVLKKPPSKPTRYSCSLCGKSFSTDKALFGHMRCHPDRTWRGCVPPAPNASLLSPRTSSPAADDDHRSSSSLSGSESLDSDLSTSLPRWSRKGKRGGKGAVSPSPSSSIPAATSEAVEIDPVLESVRGLLLLAANFDPQSPTAVLGDGSAAPAPLKKHKTVEASKAEAVEPLPILKYSCEVCNKRFARSQSLGTHRRTHSFRGWGIKDDGTAVTSYASDACCCGDGNKLMISQDEEDHDHQTVENGETSSKVLPFDLNMIPNFEDHGYQCCTTS